MAEQRSEDALEIGSHEDGFETAPSNNGTYVDEEPASSEVGGGQQNTHVDGEVSSEPSSAGYAADDEETASPAEPADGDARESAGKQCLEGPHLQPSPPTTTDVVRGYLKYRLRRSQQERGNEIFLVPSLGGHADFMNTFLGESFKEIETAVFKVKKAKHIVCMLADRTVKKFTNCSQTIDEVKEWFTCGLLCHLFEYKSIKSYNYVAAPILVLAEVSLQIQKNHDDHMGLIPHLADAVIEMYQDRYIDYWIEQRGGWGKFAPERTVHYAEREGRQLETDIEYKFPWSCDP